MASEKVLYKAKDGTLINLSTKVINNTTTDSTTDALSAAQGKVLASKFTTLTKSSVGLGNVDNTADSVKSVKYATSAGSANAVDWSKVNNKPSSYTPAAHNQAWSTITDKPALMEAGEYSADTISALLVKVQGTSPRMGSTNITKETKIPNDWYNFIYTPHRTGVGGDNSDYGTLLLFPMTSNGPSYIIRATKSGGVAHICKIYTDGNKPSKSDVGLGNVDNTADSAKSVKYATSAGSANAVAWGNVSGKPSTFAPAAHKHDHLERVEDTRSTTTKPSDYKNGFKFIGIKTLKAAGISASESEYCCLIGMNGWMDKSGGGATEIAIDISGRMFYRHQNMNSENDSFDTWRLVLTSDYVVDSLTTNYPNMPLSAHMGFELANRIYALDKSTLGKTDIIDNLNDTSTNKVLSANQGKVLNETKVNQPIYSTTDLTPGVSDLADGQIYVVYYN